MIARAKILLVGPCPPPYGGISVHVATARRRLAAAGWRARVVDLATPAPGLLARIARHARRGWAVHVHTHGHSARIWLVALACGFAARRAPARLLTLHSGLLPGFLAAAAAPTRGLVRAALSRYDRVVGVGEAIRAALAPLAGRPDRLELVPAYLAERATGTAPPVTAERWLATDGPRLAATLSFRPEYGLDVLVDAIERLEPRFPGLCCLLLGDSDRTRATAVEKSLARRGLERRFVVAGEVDHAACLALIARADLFVRPTLADGDSISVREALAAGVPVVASAVGTRPDGCVLVTPGDADGLAAAIAGVVSGTPEASAARPTPGEPDGLDRLLRIYRDIRLEGARCATARA